jgi:sterol desaturase/sphingolipid hydroxylase (fatty acid hydroxylase superfamily)
MLHNNYISATTLELIIKWLAFPPSIWVTLVLLVFFGVLLFFEHHAPREKLTKKNLKHSYKTNLGLFLFNNILMSLLSMTSLFLLAQHYGDSGLLRGISNTAVKSLLSLLALDLLLYAWHRVCHSFDCLWMFHKVHHCDPSLNVTTAFRIHFLEAGLTNILKAICIIVLGIEETMVLTSEVITTLCIMFHHTNITFKGEKLLGKVVITPYLHRAHHSVERREHDNNYGAILSVWDAMLGSRTEANPSKIGVKDYMPDNVMGLIAAGFTTKPIEPPVTIKPAVLEHMIAEAAYYKAEKRGFTPGNDLHDWLEAKREIIATVYGSRRVKNGLVANFNQNLFNQTSRQM